MATILRYTTSWKVYLFIHEDEDDPNIDAMFDMAEALIHAGADVTILAIDETALSLAEYLT